MSEEDFEVLVDFTARFSQEGEITLINVALGHTPMVLIEPEFTDKGVTFKVDSTDLDFDELAELFRLLADTLEKNNDKTNEE
jgi:Holliday junction resolvase